MKQTSKEKGIVITTSIQDNTTNIVPHVLDSFNSSARTKKITLKDLAKGYFIKVKCE